MNLFKRGTQLFCVSNIIVSFMCTSVLGINYNRGLEILEENQDKIIITADDTEPASRLGEKISYKENVNVSKTPKVTKLVSKGKTTSIVAKKEVANKVTYTPAKYNAVTGNAVVEYAMRYLGLRYAYGGNSLSTGTDCSGFTKLIYKEFGVTLSRSAKGQTSSGTFVRKSDLQKGDLVFYGTGNGKVSHVGIYIGNGQVLHESNRRDGVKISSVNMMQYITARRVINSKSDKIVQEKLNNENTTNNAINEQNNEVVVDTNNTDLVDNNQQENVQESVENNNENNSTNNNTDNNITVVNKGENEEQKDVSSKEVEVKENLSSNSQNIEE